MSNSNDDYDVAFNFVNIRTFVPINRIANPAAETNVTATNQICDFPGFCSVSAAASCSNITLKQCEQCSMPGAAVWIALSVLLGLATIAGNAFVVFFTVTKRPGFTGYYNKIRASLATADLLTGLELIFVVTYNVSWTINVTANELGDLQQQSISSPLATAFGLIHVFRVTSSLYHLVLLGVHRLYAIKYPIHFRRQTAKAAYVGIAVVWLVAIIAAVSPLCIPSAFAYAYYSTVMLFSLTLAPDYTNVTVLAVMVFFLFVLPFVLMTILGFATVIMTHIKTVERFTVRKEDALTGTEAASARRREATVCYIVAIMQAGFTVTILPIVVVVILSYSGVLACDKLSTPYFVCFYLSMTNSLVNVLIYSARDKHYVESIRKFGQSWLPQQPRPRTSSHSSAASTSMTKIRHTAGVRTQ